MIDEFKTVATLCRCETKVRGSRFIASVMPVTTKSDAETFLEGIRKEFRDATHNCYAYRLGISGKLSRFNDDGEPSGSAGKPILAAIDKLGVTNTVAVVTRYFGGTKLGVGGLMRACGEAAELALSKAKIVTKYVLQTVEATFPHSQISNVMHVVSMLGARIVETFYDEEVHITLSIRLSKSEELKSTLTDHTSGNIALKLIVRET